MSPTLIDAHLSTSQSQLAINALLKHSQKAKEKNEERELLGGREEAIWLVVAVKRMHPEKKLKPYTIPLAHPLIDPRVTSICLITKDPQRQYKDLLEEKGVKFISRVVGIEKLKGKFKPFEARRQLLQDHGFFMADERVIPVLPRLLGKMWFDAKKQPIPVSLTKKDLKAELEKAVSATYMHQNRGTCTSIKLATTSQSSAHILSNLETALPVIISNIKEGWENIQSLHIKTSRSVSLPIWTCDLGEGEGARWPTAPAKDSDATSEDGEEEKEGDSPPPPPPPKIEQRVEKGKKRGVVEEVEAPNKKIKRSDPPSSTSPNTSKSKLDSTVKSISKDKSSAKEKPVSTSTSSSKAKLPAAALSVEGKTKAPKAKEPVSEKSEKPKKSVDKALLSEQTGPSKEKRKEKPAETSQKEGKKAKPASEVATKGDIVRISDATSRKKKISPPPPGSPSLQDSVSLTAKELKKKRQSSAIGQGLEKKKEKVLTSKGKGMGRGAKGSLLGKA